MWHSEPRNPDMDLTVLKMLDPDRHIMKTDPNVHCTVHIVEFMSNLYKGTVRVNV